MTIHHINTLPYIHLDINFGKDTPAEALSTFELDAANCQHIIKTTLAQVAAQKTNYTPPHALGLDTRAEIANNKPLLLSLYLVEANEGRQLNLEYRGKDYATNVLSFESEVNELPAELLAELDDVPLGELIICLPVVVREAAEQSKTAQDHFTHLLVHGCLHLLGFDHELSDHPANTVTEADAQAMEDLEVRILQQMGITNPYLPLP